MKSIDKDALVAEIERRINEYNTPVDRLGSNNIRLNECKDVLSFINALEVKEVDLEKEIDEVIHNYKVDNHRHTSICSADIEWIAEHFFELGLKAQKGE